METDRCYQSSDLRKWSIFTYVDPDFISKIKLAFIFGTTGNEAIVVTQDDEVFSIGSNKSGCLGIGNEYLTLTPTKVNALSKKNVKGFASGTGGHVIGYTATGEVYSWGYCYYPVLGEEYDTTTFTPSAVSPNICGSKVVDVACGRGHVLFLTEKGEVYSSGGFGQSHSARKKVEFTEEEETNKVTAVACGETSCVAIMKNGKLFVWGSNDRGQLGIVTKGYHFSPRQVTSLYGVVIRKVVCGRYHAMALSDVGTLYTWGDNTYGQLGTDGIEAPVPINVTLGPYRVVDIAATHYSDMSAAMTENWKVYIWGQCGGQSTKKPMETSFTSLYDAFATYGTPRVTWKPIHIDCNAGETIPDSLRNAFDDPSNSDLTIKVNGKQIYVHKSLLKIRCQHFQSMFQEHWKEDSQNELEVDQFTYTTYRSFLQYLYTDELDVPIEHVMEMLDLAESYCETKLKRKCEQMIKNGITVENASILYSTLSQYKVKELEEFVLKFCERNIKEIIKSDSFSALGAQTGMDFLCKAVRSVDDKH